MNCEPQQAAGTAELLRALVAAEVAAQLERVLGIAEFHGCVTLPTAANGSMFNALPSALGGAGFDFVPSNRQPAIRRDRRAGADSGALQRRRAMADPQENGPRPLAAAGAEGIQDISANRLDPNEQNRKPCSSTRKSRGRFQRKRSSSALT